MPVVDREPIRIRVEAKHAIGAGHLHLALLDAAVAIAGVDDGRVLAVAQCEEGHFGVVRRQIVDRVPDPGLDRRDLVSSTQQVRSTMCAPFISHMPPPVARSRNQGARMARPNGLYQVSVAKTGSPRVPSWSSWRARTVAGEIALRVGDEQSHAAASDRGQHAIALLERVRHRFLEEDVLAGVARGDGSRFVQKVRQGDHHQVDVVAGEHRLVVGNACPPCVSAKAAARSGSTSKTPISRASGISGDGLRVPAAGATRARDQHPKAPHQPSIRSGRLVHWIDGRRFAPPARGSASAR